MVVRSWLRTLVGAGGTALVVPVGLVLAVLLAAAVGGSSVSGLSQLLGGPQAPGVGASATGTATIARAEEVPAIPTRRRPAARPQAATARRSAGAPARTDASTTPDPVIGRAPRPPARDAPARRPTATTPAVPAAPAAPGAAATPPATAVPVPAPNVVRDLGRTVQDTVRPVLPPVGTVAADAVGTVVDLISPQQPRP